ncbi:RodZ domain-containing protein [Marinobacter sp.]|uniref:RodZ domain-containing protein n=1 Tax=Marinobacter sp. TaxID=50741 RepID=UPI0019B49E00|nr:RodZ domain-containing protein [Marinobacter sp.]MBC7193193.1 DUF4115 domain-containing protein [Marinobacter sp.]
MTSEDQPTPAVQDSAGQQLRRAREALGLSVEQVADAQHLRPSVIQDIEQGRYERIDSELFLKGYVRAYAKQVNLNAESLLATLEQELEPLREERAREAEANPLVSIERKKRQKRRIAKMLAWIVILGVVIVGVMAYLDSRQTVAPSLPAEESEDSSGKDMVSPGEAEAGADNSMDEPLDDTAEPLPEEVAQAQVPVASPPEAEDVFRSEEATDDSPGRSAGETTSATPSMVPDQQPEGVLASGPMEEPVAPPVPLEMSFTGDCWVQITDANGDQLVAALKRSGDRLIVEGVPPLTVVVGAVDAVSAIRFDNKPVNMKGFRIYNNRAEFTLEL